MRADVQVPCGPQCVAYLQGLAAANHSRLWATKPSMTDPGGGRWDGERSGESALNEGRVASE